MTKTTANKPARKTSAKKEKLTMNMQVSTDLTLDNSDALLAGMLDDLIEKDAGDIDLSEDTIGDEPAVIEPQMTAAVATLGYDPVDDLAKPAAANALTVTDDELDGLEELEGLDLEAAAPLTPEQALEAEIEAAVEQGAGEPVAEPEAEAKPEKAAKAPKEPKEPKEARVTYVTGKASDVLTARVGNVNEMLLLEASDLELTAEELEAKQRDLLDMLNARPRTGSEQSTQKKVAEKVVMLFTWMKKGGSLNEVMRRTFTVLARDGHITSGDKGNLHAELLAKPYSVGTCRAQSGQMMAMLPMLKIANKGEKGRLELNPDSLIFAKIKADLGL